jgi:hypothetical protein
MKTKKKIGLKWLIDMGFLDVKKKREWDMRL